MLINSLNTAIPAEQISSLIIRSSDTTTTPESQTYTKNTLVARMIITRFTNLNFKIKDRSAKIDKKKKQMVLNGRSIKTVLLPLINKKLKK
jgi:hypothetical protein